MNKDEGRKPNSPEEEEVAVYDDATIGRAFKYSLVAFIFLVAIVGGAYMYLKRQPAPEPPKMTALAAPVARVVETVEAPTVKFTDVTAESGITFRHNSGAYGDKLLPETMGGGAAFLDFDGDGDQDLLFVNGTYWPGKIPEGRQPTTAALYQNNGKGRFTDVTGSSGLDVPIYGMGAAIGDYDRDGRDDVLITTVGGCRLFRNLGDGKFRDETASTGVGGNPKDWSTAAAWFDMDNDGDLDLYVGNYVRWSPEIDREIDYKLVGVGRAYGQPTNFEGAFPHFYRNEGNGKFTEISDAAGLRVKNSATGVPAAKTLGVVAVDLDDDGFTDLLVANDTVQNHLFHNQKNGTFKEIGGPSGVAFDSYGATRGAMGIDVARYRDDDAIGIAIGNFANEMTALYVSQGRALTFADEAITEGIGPSSRVPLKFGIFFFDYDLDGRLDLLSCNGHLEEEISKVQQSQKYAQPAQLFWNCGPAKKGCYVPVDNKKAGDDLFKPIVGRGSAYADIDGDGDLDVLLLQTGGAPMLLRNDQDLKHNWIRLKLAGKKSNPDAIGAWVSITVGNKVLRREVAATRSYLSQSELPITFGLGTNETIHAMEIRWPSGAREVNSDRASLNALINTTTRVEEPDKPAARIAPAPDAGEVVEIKSSRRVAVADPSGTPPSNDKTLIIRGDQ